MKTDKFIPKIVAPAGSLEKLQTACLYGADVVYFGGQKYNLRAAAENFSEEEIFEGVSFAHQHNVKACLLLNNFLHDSDLDEIETYLKIARQADVDSIMVSDPGVLSLVKKHTSIPITLSTQSSCANLETARFWQKVGVKRIVMARELSIEEAGLIKQETGIEVEMFVHGAMCMGWSGNCTISNFVSGRDSNRGGCCHACRFKYDFPDKQLEDITFMNSRDLRGMTLIKDFIRFKIDALKIEGRMRSMLYVAVMIKAYKKAIQAVLIEDDLSFQDALSETLKVRHRPYCEGGLNGKLTKDSIFLKDDRHLEINEGFTGKVLEVLNDYSIVLQVKNPFKIGDSLEVLTFKGDNIIIDTKKVLNLKREQLITIKPNSVILLEGKKGVEPLNLVRG